MIWDIATTYNVKRMFCSTSLDLMAQADGTRAREYTQRLTGEQLQRFGMEQLGVTLHMADIRWAEKPAEFEQLQITAYWNPSTATVEFHHGQRDGEVMILAEHLLFKPINFVAAPDMRNMFALNTEMRLEPLALTQLTYDYQGWNDAQRRWVYRLTR